MQADKKSYRGEGAATRKQRLAKLAKGPGVFVYDGSAFAMETKPTILLVGKKELDIGEDGVPLMDAAGRPLYKKSGKPVLDPVTGRPMLGGKPKVVKHPIEVYKLRGVEFPAGKEVEVDSPALALKLRGMGCFDEVGADEAPEAEPGDKAQAGGHKRSRGRKAAARGARRARQPEVEEEVSESDSAEA